MRPERGQNREQRQAQYGRVISLDRLEQMDPRPFEPIGTHALAQRQPLFGDVAVKEILAETAHGQSCFGETRVEDLAVQRERPGRMEAVGLSHSVSKALRASARFAALVNMRGPSARV